MNPVARFSNRTNRLAALGSILLIATMLLFYGKSNTKAESGAGSVNFLDNNLTQEQILKLKIDQESTPTADAVLSSKIAADLASQTQIAIKNNLINQADSLSSKLSVAPIKDDVLSKTNTTASVASSRTPITYTVVAGDTTPNVATKFGLTADTVRWANNISGDNLVEGAKLVILPVDGIMVTPTSATTADALATKYSANKEAIISYNDLPSDGAVAANLRVIVVGGKKPVEVQSVTLTQVKSSTSTTGTVTALVSNPVYGANSYAYGNCTWHASNRRAANGNPIPNNWGNAITWASIARAQGYSVDGNPRAGDVLWFKYVYGYGHVEYVEAVNADGSLTISGMNNSGIAGGGWNRVGVYNIPPSQFDKYLFIH